MKNLRFSVITFILMFLSGTAFSSACTTASNITPRLSLNLNPVSGSLAAETFSGDVE